MLAVLATACAPSPTAAPPEEGVPPGSTNPSAPSDPMSPSAQHETACERLSERMQVALDQRREHIAAPGAFLGINTPDCATQVWVSGEASPGQPLLPTHLFRAGSVTKTFTAAAILTLVDEAELDLDAPVAGILSEISEDITIRMLLNHRSGLYEYTEDAVFAREASLNPKRDYTPDELLAASLRNDPYFAPGLGWRYSNTNYIALGMIVERVTGRALFDVLRSRFVAPLGLDDTALEGAEPLPGELARGFSRDGETDLTDAYTLSWAWSAGAITSSAKDLTRWASHLYHGTVLSPETRDAMTMAQPVGVEGAAYGLGMFELSPPLAPTLMIGHNGDIAGFSTAMFTLLGDEVSMLAAVTRTGANPHEILAATIDVLFPEGVP
ncbi:MAG: serine hydrolase domain-containing protein [Myxococcota bacterium]